MSNRIIELSTMCNCISFSQESRINEINFLLNYGPDRNKKLVTIFWNCLQQTEQHVETQSILKM
jgi:hypothetical protein